MGTLEAEDKIKINYFCFWLWEYQRRNKDYMNDYKSIKNLPSLEETDDNKGVLRFVKVGTGRHLIPYDQDKPYSNFIDNHKRYPKNPDMGLTGKEILSQVINDSLLIPDPDNLSDLNVFLHSTQGFSSKLITHTLHPSELKTFTVECNFEKSFDEISHELKIIYCLCRDLGVAANYLTIKTDSTNNKERPLIDAFYELIFHSVIRNKNANINKMKRLQLKNMHRSVGLFLYDYIETHDTDFQKAYDALCNKYGEEDKFKGSQYEEESRCKEYLKATINCINDVCLYSMAKN